ncbi:hypothetical protein Vadar_018558 [Vaccinium darrowii]|uniref:Uncharacterized protein n=1 Tax=Vaccinium darrowii TaxID=229202 RepID=A0ACB7ZL38_9ERIC|nr:hypothetical protein Vadar_018558 [Vaccinium darrowii]
MGNGNSEGEETADPIFARFPSSSLMRALQLAAEVELGRACPLRDGRASGLQRLLVLLISVLESAMASNTSGNATDRIALLDFKNHITQDPFQIMPSWNDSLHFCKWIGVKCNPTNGRVTILNLESQNLFGFIRPSIGNLTFLTGINLQNNSFHSEIPQEIDRLIRIQHLNLSFNSFTGKIPSNIAHCKELTVVYLDDNELFGLIPEQLSSLSNLIFLSLELNNFSGEIPSSIENLPSLNLLSLRRNNLQGVIPEEIGYLSKLGYFAFPSNEISDTIPLAIYNISSLYHFSVANYMLQGEIPQDVGHTLPNVKLFLGGINNFTGPILVSLSNASGLQMVDFSQNMIYGVRAIKFGNLEWVESHHRLSRSLQMFLEYSGLL